MLRRPCSNPMPARTTTRFKRTVFMSASPAANNFTSTSCKPLTAPTHPSAGLAWLKNRTLQPPPNDETLVSPPIVVSIRVLHDAQVGAAPSTAAGDGHGLGPLSRNAPRLSF